MEATLGEKPIFRKAISEVPALSDNPNSVPDIIESIIIAIVVFFISTNPLGDKFNITHYVK